VGTLSDGEKRRYARHLVLPEVGSEGQERLRSASVLCVGAGGLGSPLALYLAAAGIGTLGLADFDAVDETNLHRQILYGTRDVGRPKLEAAAERLRDLNPGVNVVTHEGRLSAANALEILSNYDVVADGTDNFAARYLVNDACVLLGKPNAWAAIFRFEGQASVFDAAGGGPCYRCLFPEPPPAGAVPSCAEGGVLGVLPGLLGTIQATEVVKTVLGRGETLAGRLLLVDALAMRFSEVALRKDPSCPVCGATPTITGLADLEEACAPANAGVPGIAPRELKARLDEGAGIVLLDVREPFEVSLAALPGSHNVPLGSLPGRLGLLQKDADIVALCRTGARSAAAVELLLASGYGRARNLVGGLDRWRREVDPGLPPA
jgi:molybdopterin/thiamine biosynthesis adenylyltransferase/rhodanese-related sulfurtransferase